MKCPICDKELSEGYILHMRKPVQWIPNDRKPSRLAFGRTDGGIDLKHKASFTAIEGFKAEAFYCDKCHIVIAPTQ